MDTKENIQTLAARSAKRTLYWIEELTQEATVMREKGTHTAAEWLDYHISERLKPLRDFEHQTSLLYNLDESEREYWQIFAAKPLQRSDYE